MPRPTPHDIAALFAAQRRTDPLGSRVHLYVACGFLFFSGWATTWVDVAALCLLICGGIRLLSHHRILSPLVHDPVARLAVLWAAWIALSRLWSAGDWHDWAADAGSIRYVMVIALLYPVLDRRPLLILVLALGLISGELSQLAHFIGLQFHIPALTWHRDPQRISGWWDPVVAGSLLCALLGLCCGIAIPGDAPPDRVDPDQAEASTQRVRLSRALAAVMIPVTLLAILATGTRGAWIAAAVLILITLIIAARRALSLKSAALALAALAILITAIWFASPALRARAERGVSEVTSALHDRKYTSDTGQRLSMWIWATRCIQHNPILGVGAGGYKPFARDFTPTPPHPDTPPSSPLPLPHAHAHSWFLHTLATLGLVGIAILVALLTTAFRAGLHPSPLSPGPSLALALLGLTLAGLFDTIHVNQQTANLFYILLALSVPSRPPSFTTESTESPEKGKEAS